MHFSRLILLQEDDLEVCSDVVYKVVLSSHSYIGDDERDRRLDTVDWPHLVPRATADIALFIAQEKSERVSNEKLRVKHTGIYRLRVKHTGIYRLRVKHTGIYRG